MKNCVMVVFEPVSPPGGEKLVCVNDEPSSRFDEVYLSLERGEEVEGP